MIRNFSMIINQKNKEYGEAFMHYAPGQESLTAISPFKSCTIPRPIGWLSTISADGVLNLAPYSQWQNLSFDPPLVMFAANQISNGEKTHWRQR